MFLDVLCELVCSGVNAVSANCEIMKLDVVRVSFSRASKHTAMYLDLKCTLYGRWALEFGE